MEKIVNGQLIDISAYWSLFNRVGLDSAKERRVITNSLTFIIEEKAIKLVKDICNVYSDIYSKIPYPLNMIESDIKYAMIAHLLHRKLKCKNKIYIDNGISIRILDGIYMILNRGSWGIVDNEPNKKNELLGLKDYGNDCGYREFIWLYKRLRDNKDTDDFYKECFTEIYDACKGEGIVINWELMNILNIHKIPNMKCIEGRVVDLESNELYLVDVNNIDEVIVDDNTEGDTEDDTECMDGIFEKAEEYEVKHNIKVYKKKLELGKMNVISSEYERVDSGLFDILKDIVDDEQLNGILNNITGILYYNRLFIEIGHKIYDIDLTDGEYKVIDSGVEFLGVPSNRRDRVYYRRSEYIEGGVKRESIYYYDMEENRLCEVRYKYGAYRN